MTTYDQIWTSFLSNCKTSGIDLPQTSEKIYDSIHNAIRHFNNRLRDNLSWDDANEVVNRGLSDDHLLILSHYIRYIFLLNQKTYFQNLFQPFTSDIGLRNFNTQLKSLETSVEKEEETIERLIMNTEEDFL
ncbi:hypothetical protein AB1283_00585 [Bacillus sp. S13(2024)]|uniref:hypothetical protein n=1 Tax=Bacillus sp. S13(2024) TaxID=3162885 RepID=UPI003D19F434